LRVELLQRTNRRRAIQVGHHYIRQHGMNLMAVPRLNGQRFRSVAGCHRAIAERFERAARKLAD
jgi:hypothetical protein